MTSEIVDGGYRVNASDGWTPASVAKSKKLWRCGLTAATGRSNTIDSLGANGILTTACLQSHGQCELCDRDTTIHTLA